MSARSQERRLPGLPSGISSVSGDGPDRAKIARCTSIGERVIPLVRELEAASSHSRRALAAG